jgi:hypothetical protein
MGCVYAFADNSLSRYYQGLFYSEEPEATLAPLVPGQSAKILKITFLVGGIYYEKPNCYLTS